MARKAGNRSPTRRLLQNRAQILDAEVSAYQMNARKHHTPQATTCGTIFASNSHCDETINAVTNMANTKAATLAKNTKLEDGVL